MLIRTGSEWNTKRVVLSETHLDSDRTTLSYQNSLEQTPNERHKFSSIWGLVWMVLNECLGFSIFCVTLTPSSELDNNRSDAKVHKLHQHSKVTSKYDSHLGVSTSRVGSNLHAKVHKLHQHSKVCLLMCFRWYFLFFLSKKNSTRSWSLSRRCFIYLFAFSTFEKSR